MTQITYDLTLDPEHERVVELKVTTLCASREPGAPVLPKEKALTEAQHIAFIAVYRFSDFNEVERFDVPAEAGKMLR
jgi:hypothetical protein